MALSLMLLGLFNAQVLVAHRINVFASVEGDQICGYVYTANGTRVSDAVVRLSTVGNGEAEQVETKTDANGEFSAKPLATATHRIVAATSDGHRAVWTISEQPFTATARDAVNGLTTDAADSSASDSPIAADASSKQTQPSVKDDTKLQTIISRELAPLRRDINRLENRIRLQDTLGGIGYIVGITGLIPYMLAIRKKNT